MNSENHAAKLINRRLKTCQNPKILLSKSAHMSFLKLNIEPSQLFSKIEKPSKKKKIQRVVRRILRKNPAQKLNLIQQMIAPDEKRKGRV